MALAVYVHVPWCLQRCPYCDFASTAVRSEDIPHEAYADAVIAELALRAPHFGGPLGTLFFGGGTPSLWRPAAIARVIASARDRFGTPDEVTVECNPTSLDAARTAGWIAAGVTRLSIGVQSLRDTNLRYLGRLHDAAGAVRAVTAAVDAGGLRVSADVMYGMPGQQPGDLVDDARRLVELGVEHLSAYALTVEPDTRFGELARKGRLPRLVDDDVATLYEVLERALRSDGFGHYEVSNYARPGCEAQHNLAYWRGAEYIGLGAGAVGCWRETPGIATRYRNVHDVNAYLRAAANTTLPPDEREALDAGTLVREGLMLGLRTRSGVDLSALAARAGCDPRGGREQQIARAVSRGELDDTGTTLRIPASRWLVADGIVASLF